MISAGQGVNSGGSVIIAAGVVEYEADVGQSQNFEIDGEKMPRVSVVLPVYNRAHLVGEAARSVLGQSYSDYELIIVDDGSTDSTSEALGEFSGSAIILHQQNKGPAAARNLAVSKAGGELLAFIDSDDIWLAEKLERQVAFLDANPWAGLVHCDGWLVNGAREKADLESQPTFYQRRKPPEGEAAAARIMRTPVITSHVVLRREVLDRVGLFPEDLLIHEDVDLFLRMLEAGVGFGFVDRPLVIKRVFGDSLAIDTLRYILMSIEVEYRSYMRSPVLHPHLEPAMLFSHKLAAWALYLKGERRKARRHLVRALRLKPLSPRTALAVTALSMPDLLGRRYLERIFPEQDLEKVWNS